MIPCAKSELMLFDEIPVQTSMTSSSWVDFHSISNPTSGGPIEFYIAGTQDEYLDLNDTKLYLQAKLIVDTKDALVSPVNLLLSSLFQDVSITLSDQVCQGGDQLYAYKAMINTMLLFDKSTKETQLAAAGYIQDQAGKFNDATNTGFVFRNVATKDAVFELIGPLHLDLMTQPRFILPQVDIKLRMTRQTDAFTLLCFNKGGKPAKIEIQKAILYVRKVKVLPSVVHGHELGLDNYNAIYPLQNTSGQTFTIPSGTQSVNRENIFQGRMPKLVVVCMVNNSAFNGAFNQNPFFFQHFNVSYLGLFRDGESIPERQPYEITDEGLFLRPYMGMIHALEQFNRNETNGITLDEYKGGSTFFVFNLTPDLVVGSGCQQAYRSGNLRLEMKFSKALASTINVIVYGIFDGKIEITKKRNILIDH